MRIALFCATGRTSADVIGLVTRKRWRSPDDGGGEKSAAVYAFAKNLLKLHIAGAASSTNGQYQEY